MIHSFNTVAPVFDWPRELFANKGSQSVNNDLRVVLLDHRVNYFTGPISHLLSTELLEWAVPEMLAQSSKKPI